VLIQGTTIFDVILHYLSEPLKKQKIAIVQSILLLWQLNLASVESYSGAKYCPYLIIEQNS
jgi:hypothetical protein